MKTRKAEREIIELLAKTMLFQNVSAQGIENLVCANKGFLKKFRRNELLLRADEVIPYVCVIMKGSVRLSHTMQDGHEAMVHVLKERKCIGIECAYNQHYKSNFDYLALTDVTLFCIPSAVITSEEELGAEMVHQLLLNMIRLASHESTRQQQVLSIHSLGTVRNKISGFLYYEYQKTNQLEFDISFTRESLAAYLCVNRSVLSREIGLMEKEGLIKTKGKHFVILDTDIFHRSLR